MENTNSPTFLFWQYESALQRRDLKAAASAASKLKALGFSVATTSPKLRRRPSKTRGIKRIDGANAEGGAK